MSGFYITELRLKALDFPGQIALFTNLKTPVYFRNATLDWIAKGGWAELPIGHYNAFVKALEEGWVRGERQWHVDKDSFTRHWRTPQWDTKLVTAGQLNIYTNRCKSLLSKGVLRPFQNNPEALTTELVSYMVELIEKDTSLDADSYYSIISGNLKSNPNQELTHRAFVPLFKKTIKNYKYSHIGILSGFSKGNPKDRKLFMSWLFKSPEHFASVGSECYGVHEVISEAIASKELWYTGVSHEDKGSVPTVTCTQESAAEVFSPS